MSLISIVLPVYNGEQYLEESICSVLKQTIEDWELIIVDDCSEDETFSIIEKYEKMDNRIRGIRNETNQKLPKSLNIGFSYAKGKYLTWTSDDNIFLPNALEKMLQYLEINRDIPMVCAGMDMIDSSGNIIGSFEGYEEKLMYFNNCVGACFMYRYKVLEEIGNYNLDWFLIEDYEYWMRILFFYGKIGYISQTLYKYRYHNNSLTATRTIEIGRQLAKFRIKYINKIIEQLKDDKNMIVRIFYELKKNYDGVVKFEDIFYKLVPELKMDKGIDKNKKIIIFGAGEYGNYAFLEFSELIVYYVDSNIKKVGTQKNGIEILPVSALLDITDEFQVMIAVNNEYILEILQILQKYGLKECCVYQV